MLHTCKIGVQSGSAFFFYLFIIDFSIQQKCQCNPMTIFKKLVIAALRVSPVTDLVSADWTRPFPRLHLHQPYLPLPPVASVAHRSSVTYFFADQLFPA